MKKKQIEHVENVAYLYAVERAHPDDIATLLDMGTSSVWRYLRIALGDDPHVKLPQPLLKQRTAVLNVPERDRKRIRANVLHRTNALARFPDLLDRLNEYVQKSKGDRAMLQGLRVIPSTEGAAFADNHVEWEQAVAEFGRAAAPRVAEILRSSRIIGISWGRTLQAITQALLGLNLKPREKARRATAFPVCGDVFGNAQSDDFSKVFPDPIRLSPSFLAAQLATALNGTAEGTPSLIAVSSVIPIKYQSKMFGSRSEADVIKEFYSGIHGYQRIFGSQRHVKNRPTEDKKTQTEAAGQSKKADDDRPLIEQMDSMLAGVGPPQYWHSFWTRPVLKNVDISLDEIKSLFVGGMGGLLIPRPSLSAKQKARVDACLNCYTGIQFENIKQCASKARMPDASAPGVIAFAVGRDRSELATEITRLGLVNHLIIDDDLARDLDHRLPKHST